MRSESKVSPEAKGLARVRSYHDKTKHNFNHYADSLGYMDWANQPCPFRYYTDTEIVKLDLDRQPSPLPYEALYDPVLKATQPVNLGTLADFLRYGMALSAWKQAGGWPVSSLG